MQHGPPSPFQQAAQPKKSTNWIILLVVIGGIGLIVLPIFAAMAIYGVRRYLAAAKTAEAKNSIGAISRAARASFEREQITADGATKRSLCDTAIPVPARVPSGVKYMPGTGSGVDFDTGDAVTGWKCLRFSMTHPIYYQYSYTKGRSPVMAAKGGSATVSGPESFEVAAQGDLDGDSTTSAFVLVGQQDASGELRVATQIFIADEFE